jgi:hypothetical protein
MSPLFTTVMMPATDRSLITLGDLREQLQFNPNNTADDAWLTKVIARTSLQAERYCDRIFVQQGYADTFRDGDPSRLILSQAPVDPDSLVITVDGVALDAADYDINRVAGLVYGIDQTSLIASYTAGFDPIPDDVQQAVLQLCVVEVQGRGRDPMLRATESAGARQEFWVGGVPGSSTLPQDIAGLLNPYRRGLVG